MENDGAGETEHVIRNVLGLAKHYSSMLNCDYMEPSFNAA
jgi:hypothetical protein